MRRNSKIGIISIATNGYLQYWKNQIVSWDKSEEDFSEVTFILFTDEKEEALEFSSHFRRFKIDVFEIPSLLWPEATLFRFSIINDCPNLRKFDFLIYIDADMLIEKKWLDQIGNEIPIDSMIFVSHPGFWRPKRAIKKFKLYFIHPVLFIRDCRMRIKLGGLGAWENRSNHYAYVSRKLRKNYVCGGLWMGAKGAFLDMCQFLSLQVQQDYELKQVPVWHDESYVNKYILSLSKVVILKPEFCHEISYPQLKDIPAVVTAVKK